MCPRSDSRAREGGRSMHREAQMSGKPGLVLFLQRRYHALAFREDSTRESEGVEMFESGGDG